MGLALGAVVSAVEPGRALPGGEAKVLVPKSASPLRFSLGLSSPLGIDPSFPRGHPIPVCQGLLGTDWVEASIHESVALVSSMVLVPQFLGKGTKR